MSLFSSLLPTLTPSRVPGTTGNTTQGITSGRRPAYQINEASESYTLTVSLPGVSKGDLTVTAENGVLTIIGKRAWRQPETWTPLHRESTDADYNLALSYENAIDAEKISAALTDGVLRLTLPKSAARKPRKITVN